MAYCVLHSTCSKFCGLHINWPIARPGYEIHVIKISVSPEKRKMDFFKFPKS